MAGIDSRTGKPLDGFAHVEQSLDKIITTHLGERVTKEWFGNPGTKLLGETATPSIILQWVTIIWSLVELFEPRFKIKRFQPNSIDRGGTFDLTMVGEYRPYAHLDWVQAELFISIQNGSVVLSAAR